MIKRFYKKIINSTKNKVVRNIGLVAGLALLAKLVSFYKETLVSSSFGLSTLLDTYHLAILIPSFIQMISLKALKNLFVPNYVREMKTTKELGSFQSFVFSTISVLFVSLSILTLIFSLFLEYFFSGHTIEYYLLLRKQLYIVIPCILLWGVSSILSGLLEIHSKFFYSTVVIFFTPLVTIINVIFFKDFFGDTVLVWSMLIGTILSTTLLFLFARKYDLIKIGKPRINDNIKEMIKQYPPKIVSGLLSGANPFIDQFFAAQLVVGSIASINYGVKLPTIAIGILMMAIGNVFLPYFSKAFVTDRKKAYHRLFKILAIIFTGSFLITLVFFIWSYDIIEILFERGEFTSKDTMVVSSIQKIAFLYVPFYLCILVCVKFLTAANENKFMAWVSFFNLFVNLIMNFVLVEKYGLYGLVISTTVVYIISSIIYFTYTYNGYKKYVSTIEE